MKNPLANVVGNKRVTKNLFFALLVGFILQNKISVQASVFCLKLQKCKALPQWLMQ